MNSLAELLEEAYKEALHHCIAPKSSALKLDEQLHSFGVVEGAPGLLHAFSEILLNALQAPVKPADQKIWVDLVHSANGDPAKLVQIEVRDNGPGFSADQVKFLPRPFFTTRVVGVGLGLYVASEILRAHSGTLSLVPGPPGIVRVSLPLKSVSAKE